MKKSLTLLVVVAIVTLAKPLQPVSARGHMRNPGSRATTNSKFHKTEKAAPGQYIVMLRKDTPRSQISALASTLTRAHGGVVEYIYTDIFKGFSVKQMSEAQAKALSRHPLVTSVEESARVQVTGQQFWPEESGVIKPLDRIDQRSGELDAFYNYPRTGTGVHVYIVDTGVWVQHNDFGGRAFALWDFQPSTSIGGYATGNDNHGTLSASAVGSKTWGVAKNCLLYSVRVHRILSDGSEQGTASDIAAGLQQVLNDVNNNNKRPAVVNISLETPRTAFGVGSMETAVTNLINAGITVVSGAGNNNLNASNFSPGWMPAVINVGASTGVPGGSIDAKASYSNFGTSVDVYAPAGDFGWSVRNAGHNTTYGFDGNCCTSIAAPEVTGVIALYLEQFSLDAGNFSAQPAQVQTAIKNNASFMPLPIVYMGCDFILPPASNPIDETRIFIRQHYYDFLNRQPDQGGWDFWTGTIDGCGGDAQCIEVHRINASRAFFESIEFQGTGYYVFRLNKISFSSFTGGNEVGGPNPRMEDFFVDQKKVGAGLIVGQPGWEQVLDQNKSNFAAEWVNRPRFLSEYPEDMSNEDFVDKLYATAGVSDPATRDAMVNGLYNFTETRGSVVRKIADSSAVADNHPLFRNPAYVLMQYFGYLRRNPDDPPDNINCPSDPLCGYHFWLNHLNEVEDSFEMVHAFIASAEYRNRFYQPPFCQ